ncbi:MAG: hypothetical protein HY376_02110 [Candidatus Blackburnbacteria bacterium]|nr:hypothetical protein [Candidatus Blackburnbacteria bacterium]
MKTNTRVDPVEIASKEDLCAIFYDKNHSIVNVTVYFLNFTVPKQDFIEFAKVVNRAAKSLLAEDTRDVV